jgi:hypothetical protein
MCSLTNSPQVSRLRLGLMSKPPSDITRHEWNIAMTAERYVFHIWSLKESKKMLSILLPKDIEAHIPLEKGKGL